LRGLVLDIEIRSVTLVMFLIIVILFWPWLPVDYGVTECCERLPFAVEGKGLRARLDSSKTPSVAGALVALLSFDHRKRKMRVCARIQISLV
jgi:hypothetical protein